MQAVHRCLFLDFEEADEEAGITASWREAKNLTWHHNQKLGKMELVPKALNNLGEQGLWPAGGAQISWLLYGTGYGK